VLVDENNNQVDTVSKTTVHTKDTPLHRGFSLFVFNFKKEILLTKRAKTKKTFPGVWTNTVCGHPQADEEVIDAARRRLRDELGMIVENIEFVSDYRYKFTDKNGIVENEICPILIAYSDQSPAPNNSEVEACKWIQWEDFIKDLKSNSEKYSPWSKEEVEILIDRNIPFTITR